MNYVTHLLNQGQLQFRLFQFELYQLALKYDLIEINGKIPLGTFLNICRTSCLLGKLDFAESFLSKYKQFLGKKIESNVISFSKGSLYFYQKKFDKTFDKIFNISFHHSELKILARPLLIRTYFELILARKSNHDYNNLLKKDLKSLQRYIAVSTLFAVEKKPAYLHFVDAMRLLIKIKNNKSQFNRKTKIQQLKSQLSNQKHSIICRDWFFRKTRGNAMLIDVG